MFTSTYGFFAFSSGSVRAQILSCSSTKYYYLETSWFKVCYYGTAWKQSSLVIDTCTIHTYKEPILYDTLFKLYMYVQLCTQDLREVQNEKSFLSNWTKKLSAARSLAGWTGSWLMARYPIFSLLFSSSTFFWSMIRLLYQFCKLLCFCPRRTFPRRWTERKRIILHYPFLRCSMWHCSVFFSSTNFEAKLKIELTFSF